MGTYDYELTEETIEGVEVYSTADLISKNRNVVVNDDLIYKELTATEFGAVTGINIRRSYYFITNKMATVYLDFIVESGYTSLSKETVISANVFPKAVNVSYVQLTPISTATTGYGFINKDSGCFAINVPVRERFFVHFSYPIA